MLQATDVTRFRPVPADPAHAHDVVVVAKSRDVFRSAVADAIAAGLRPAIYGSGWEPFVDPALVVSAYVPNEELPVVYSSAGVLLNDHWESMHEWGFVSNRLFDALACETPVISDDLPEIAELFDGTVLTYRDPTELRELVDATLADPTAARRARGTRAAHRDRAPHVRCTAPSSSSTRSLPRLDQPGLSETASLVAETTHRRASWASGSGEISIRIGPANEMQRWCRPPRTSAVDFTPSGAMYLMRGRAR